jgi:hypothetical protein
MLALALDPGITTGYAVGEIWGHDPDTNDDVDSQGRFRFLYADEAKLSEAGLWYLLCSISPAFLIAESFEFRQNTRDNVELFSRNLLGVSRLWTELAHSDFRSQSPSEGKGFYTDKKLRQLGYYSRGKVHARDATRHLLYFMAFKGGSRFHSRESRLAIFSID